MVSFRARLLHLLVALVLAVATASSGVAAGCRMAHACPSCPAPSTDVAWSANGGCAHMAPAAPRLLPTDVGPRLIATPVAVGVAVVSLAPPSRLRPTRVAVALSVEASPPLVLRV